MYFFKFSKEYIFSGYNTIDLKKNSLTAIIA